MPRIPQIVSSIDREPFSKTYGSFDRTYWCWKFTDFSASRLQEGVYTLAWLYTTPGNDFYGNERTLEWIRAGFAWWGKLQHRNGAFDEAYPFEMSFAATAFTCFYLGEACALVKDQLPPETTETFRKAGDWFKKNDEKHGVLTNHLAAAAAALFHIARITNDQTCEARAWFFLDRILDRQSTEGWYEEYGGADIGYQTHGMFYLARIWRMTGAKRLLASLEKACVFIEETLNPDGTIGGEYASRNTEFYYPAAFEMLAEDVPAAARIALRMRGPVEAGGPVGVAAMDAWNLYPVLNNYLFAHDAAKNSALPLSSPGFKKETNGLSCTLFRDAGWIIARSPRYQAALGISKGGVIKAWTAEPPRLAYSDCGYWMKLENGKIFSSQSFVRAPVFDNDASAISFEADFAEVNQKILNPVLFIGFRGFSIILGQIPALSYWLKDLLVRTLVRRRKKGPFRLRRIVTFTDDGFEIEDTIIPSSFLRVVEFRRGSRFATIHMGSSRYFQQNELLPEAHPQSFLPEAEALSKGLQVKLTSGWSAEKK